MSGLNWSVKGFRALEPGELYRILRLREKVFILEQECLYQDIDDKDQASVHLMGADPENGVLAAYARIVPPGLTFAEPSIGRVVTAPGYRGLRLGKELMQRSVQAALERYPGAAIRISAQAHLQRFYGEFGFIAEGNLYLEDGIDHISMVRRTSADIPFLDIHTHRPTGESSAIYNLSVDELEKTADTEEPGNSNEPSTAPAMLSAGIHPWDLQPGRFDEQRAWLTKVAGLPQIVLIGECGLDKLEGPPLEEQMPAFVEQIRIASRHRKPVIIHCVKAYNELISIQKEHRFDTPMVIHGYHKSAQLAQQLTAQGFLLSFGSAIQKKHSLAETLSFLHSREIPFFLETDDSLLSIVEIYEHAAFLLKISVDELKDVIFAAWKKIGLNHG